MSYRPTISIYVEGEIVDYGYYRNWEDEDLFYEAVAFASVFHDCKTREDYLERAYHTQKLLYVVSPEKFENTPENLHFFEESSEFPVVVDLSLQNIYVNYGAVSREELSLFHPYDEPYSFEEYVRLQRFLQEHKSACYCRNEYSEAQYRRFYESLMRRSRAAGTRMDFSTLLGNYRVPFDRLDLAEIREMYRKSKDLRRHCSRQICALLDAA